MTPILDGAICDLVSDRQLQQRTTRPNLLFTLTQNYGHENKLDWHIDARRLAGMKLAGVQLFTFLESVKPGGGGPVAVTGSHRIETRENVSREIIRSQLRDHSFFADVFDYAPEARADLVGKNQSSMVLNSLLSNSPVNLRRLPDGFVGTTYAMAKLQ